MKFQVVEKVLGGTIITFGLLNYFIPITRYVTGVISIFAVYRLSKLLYSLYHYRTTEFLHKPSIKIELSYQNKELLEKAWSKPAAIFYKNKIEYQPREGLCGYATLNSVLSSLEKKPLKYPRIGGPFHMKNLQEYTQKQLGDQFNVEALPASDREIISKILRTEVNDPKNRFMANFLRGPLFFSDTKSWKRVLGGHWSPVIAYLPEEDLLLILDVNDTYGAWLVSVDRFVDSLNTVDHTTGGGASWRGLLKVTYIDGRKISG